ncbi:hypothetical protein ACFP81_07030 [Deinococcus lacus]|uniref:Uncharacterized protein n=1 Tax=Deinococcus lacus TaxID=392561 RepID=A0ABW1YBX0_9DEIO
MEYKWQPSVIQSLQSQTSPGVRAEVTEYSAYPLEQPLAGWHQSLSRPAPYRQLVLHTQGSSVTLEPGVCSGCAAI